MANGSNDIKASLAGPYQYNGSGNTGVQAGGNIVSMAGESGSVSWQLASYGNGSVVSMSWYRNQ